MRPSILKVRERSLHYISTYYLKHAGAYFQPIMRTAANDLPVILIPNAVSKKVSNRKRQKRYLMCYIPIHRTLIRWHHPPLPHKNAPKMSLNMWGHFYDRNVLFDRNEPKSFTTAPGNIRSVLLRLFLLPQ